MRGLFAAVMLMGIYSFLGASWMLLLDAPDVAFTEASVGAGISTILALATLALTTRKAKTPVRRPALPLLVVAVTGAALVYGTLDMPHFAAPDAPPNNSPPPSYLYPAQPDIHVPPTVPASTPGASPGSHCPFGRNTSSSSVMRSPAPAVIVRSAGS